MLDCREIWLESYPKQTTHSCKISCESIVPFVRCGLLNALKIMPAIDDAPETSDGRFAVKSTALGNGTLYSDAILQEFSSKQTTFFCQISRQSSVSFVRSERRKALRKFSPIGGARNNRRWFVAYRTTPLRNGTLDYHEIWKESSTKQTTHSCQLSRKSTVPFVRSERRKALRKLSPIGGARNNRRWFAAYRTPPLRNGTLDSHEIWKESSSKQTTHTYQFSRKSTVPFVRYQSFYRIMTSPDTGYRIYPDS